MGKFTSIFLFFGANLLTAGAQARLCGIDLVRGRGEFGDTVVQSATATVDGSVVREHMGGFSGIDLYWLTFSPLLSSEIQIKIADEDDSISSVCSVFEGRDGFCALHRNGYQVRVECY